MTVVYNIVQAKLQFTVNNLTRHAKRKLLSQVISKFDSMDPAIPAKKYSGIPAFRYSPNGACIRIAIVAEIKRLRMIATARNFLSKKRAAGDRGVSMTVRSALPISSVNPSITREKADRFSL